MNCVGMDADAGRVVYHAADVLFTFGAPILGVGGNWSQSDQVLSATMLDYWSVHHFSQKLGSGSHQPARPAPIAHTFT